MARPPKSKAIERLQKALDAIPELKQLPYGSPKFKKWERDTQVALRNTFEDNSNQLREFKNIRFSPTTVSTMGTPNSTGFQKAYMKGLESATAVLESMIEEVQEYWEDDNQVQSLSGTQANDRPSSNQVFVIHGRDEGTRELVARFLEKLGLKPVILQEQPSEGRTIIEKFEAHADAQFAVALLTPDDAGSLQRNKNKLSPRARQNVIFELGFFIGRLGRNGVCALTKGDVEIPSDYAGVVYIPLDDSAGWKQRLFQELDAAGYQIDAHKAFRA